MSADDYPVDRSGRILRELQALRADVRRIAMAPAGVVRLAALLPAILAHVRDRSFNAAELCEFAVSKLAGAPAFRVALECAVGDLDEGAVRRLGKLLSAGAGVDVLGLTVEQVGQDRDGQILRVCRSETHLRQASACAVV